MYCHHVVVFVVDTFHKVDQVLDIQVEFVDLILDYLSIFVDVYQLHSTLLVVASMPLYVDLVFLLNDALNFQMDLLY